VSIRWGFCFARNLEVGVVSVASVAASKDSDAMMAMYLDTNVRAQLCRVSRQALNITVAR
jgi:hypothetical protein